jgi:dephospho-CoA kinase
MKIIGITGGIGSGKTTVCRIFETLGIPVFNADAEASDIYNAEPRMIEELRSRFGNSVIMDEQVNKKELARIVFNDEKALARLNNIVHPMVKKRFEEWKAVQDSPYVIREAAILIESGSYKDCDAVIMVIADELTKIRRVINRSGLDEEEVRQRMARQMTDEQRRPFCNYVISNNETDSVLPAVMAIHAELCADIKV